MGNLIFFIKSIVTTIIVVFLMQIQIGQHTIEDHAMFWIHDSKVALPLQEVADGGVKVIRDFWHKITKGIKTDFTKAMNSENKPGSRKFGIALERSEEYIKKQAKKAAEKLDQELSKEPDTN